MDFGTVIDAILLGNVEGLTELIPVSYTAHLLLATEVLGLASGDSKAFWDTFNVMIQLGAILAVVVVYFGRLWRVLLALPSDPNARRFVVSILVAFLPAALIGALAFDFIKTVLFDSPELICWVLIVGGVALALLDRYDVDPVHQDAMRYPVGVALAIGVFQCLAMVPGVSRSGATIVGALLLGVGRRAAAEFSFFLAMPTMSGAFAYDLYKTGAQLDFSDAAVIVAGFLTAFLSAVLVVRALLDFVSRHGFALFGWWRIAVGGIALAALLAGG